MKRRVAWLAAVLVFAAVLAFAACQVRTPPRPQGAAARKTASASASASASAETSLAVFEVKAYRLRLQLDPSASDFHGEMEIAITLDRAHAGDVFALHADGLDIAAATLVIGAHTQPLRVLPPAITPDTSFRAPMLHLAMPAHDDLPATTMSRRPTTATTTATANPTATLRLRFRGTFHPHEGLLQRRFGDEAFIFSDLEPEAARQVFPHIDRPDVKVPWTVILDVPHGMPAFSNAPVHSRSPMHSGLDRVVFAATKPLPSYLIAVAVGPLVEVPVPGAPLPARLLVPASLVDYTSEAVAVLPAILRVATEVVGLPLPFEKQDFVAVPDFGGNAMENPGLITFDANALVAPLAAGLGLSRGPIGEGLAIVLAHEIAHLWFGDLATLTTWRDLWIHEGFATYLSFRILDQVFPQWQIGLEEIDERRGPEKTDRLLGAQPVRPASAATPELLFTPMTYVKGGAMIETVASAAGHDAMLAAVREVLAAHAYRNVTGEQLFAAMAHALPATFGDEASRLLLVTELFEHSGQTEIEISTRCAVATGRTGPSSASGASGADDAVIITTIKQVVATYPLCLHLGDLRGSTRTCVALTDRAEIPTKGCARYAVPSNGEGYVHATWSPDLQRLSDADRQALTPRERYVLDRDKRQP